AGRPDYSDEMRAKMSKSAKNKPKISEETRRKISENSRKMWEKRIDRTKSEETINRIKVARARQVMKPISDEHKQRIAEANRKRKGTTYRRTNAKMVGTC